MLPLIPLQSVVSPDALAYCDRVAFRVAHDIGNAAAVFQGHAARLAPSLPGDAARRLDAVRGAFRGVEDLADHMSRYLGRAPIPETDLPWPSWLGSPGLEDELKTAARGRRLVLRVYENTAGHPTLRADSPALRAALGALVANAADAMVDEPPAAAIQISCGWTEVPRVDLRSFLRSPDFSDGLHAFLRVEDTGTGIPPELVGLIFHPAYSSRIRQPGFGLSDAYGIVCRQHHGAIGVRSAPGDGSEFTLYF